MFSLKQKHDHIQGLVQNINALHRANYDNSRFIYVATGRFHAIDVLDDQGIRKCTMFCEDNKAALLTRLQEYYDRYYS